MIYICPYIFTKVFRTNWISGRGRTCLTSNSNCSNIVWIHIKINSLIVDNVKRLGCTSITITHDLNSIKKIADKVAMINEGKIVWHGNKQDLRKSKNKTINEFINTNYNISSKSK